MVALINAYMKVSDWPLKNFPPIRKWFTELPWRAKLETERAKKSILETGVKCDVAFCLGSSIKKTNSGT